MVRRLLIASLLGAIAMFVWGFLFWAVLAVAISPWKPLSAYGTATLESLKRELPAAGVYQYPWVDGSSPDHEGMEQEFQRQQEQGPFVQIVYDPAGMAGAAMGMVMLKGFLHMLASALLASVLLQACGPMCCYTARWAQVTGFGVLATLWVEVGDSIWWHHPLSHVAFVGVYHIVNWAIAGAVLAACLRGTPASTAAPGESKA
ncbi:MAG: hypothetical protein D6753_13040 [Planctomycetota bacterium]|nr:MAG: hypothetical protein D6753_13040 [Planctomycetota bacterium]